MGRCKCGRRARLGRSVAAETAQEVTILHELCGAHLVQFGRHFNVQEVGDFRALLHALHALGNEFCRYAHAVPGALSSAELDQRFTACAPTAIAISERQLEFEAAVNRVEDDR